MTAVRPWTHHGDTGRDMNSVTALEGTVTEFAFLPFKDDDLSRAGIERVTR